MRIHTRPYLLQLLDGLQESLLLLLADALHITKPIKQFETHHCQYLVIGVIVAGVHLEHVLVMLDCLILAT